MIALRRADCKCKCEIDAFSIITLPDKCSEILPTTCGCSRLRRAMILQSIHYHTVQALAWHKRTEQRAFCQGIGIGSFLSHHLLSPRALSSAIYSRQAKALASIFSWLWRRSPEDLAMPNLLTRSLSHQKQQPHATTTPMVQSYHRHEM